MGITIVESSLENGEIKESAKPKSDLPTGHAINIHSIGNFEIFEVKEEELELIENGLGESIFFNLVIAFLSITISFLIAIFSIEYTESPITYIFYMLAIMVGAVASIISFFLWFPKRKNIPKIIEKIRKRAKESIH